MKDPAATRRTSRPEKAAPQYVGDYGTPVEDAGDKVAVAVPLVLLACAIGLVVGAAVWGALLVSSILVRLIWHDLPAVLPFSAPWLPLVVCALGGLIIGLWNKKFRNAPESLEKVMAQVRATGGYRVKGVLSSVVSFLLPIAFGGSIGPEAGLTGLIASACTWIGNCLKRAGLKAKAVTDLTLSATLSAVFATPLLGIVATAEDESQSKANSDAVPPHAGAEADEGKAGDYPLEAYAFRKPAKFVLYAAAAFGAFGGVALVTDILGGGSGLPRFPSLEVHGADVLWTVPLSLAGWVLALVFHASNRAFGAAAARFKPYSVAPPVIAGVFIGLLGMFLPNVLFSGEEQCIEIIGEWGAVGAAALLATGVFKVVATPLCLNFGWRGGNFFPCIFAGVSFGYGVAAVTGLDPMVCVMSITTSLVAGMTRKPLLTLALLIMCFPIDGLMVSGIAAVLGAALPVPRSLLPVRDIANPEGEEGAVRTAQNSCDGDLFDSSEAREGGLR